MATKEPAHINKSLPERIQPISKLEDKVIQPQQTAEPIVAEIKEVAKPQPPVHGSKQDWLVAAGIPQSDWSLVDSIVSRESGWKHTVWNSTGSGAYGLCQALPAQKMQSAGLDYITNPVTQLKWCNSYAKERYGSWQAAVQFWNANHWW